MGGSKDQKVTDEQVAQTKLAKWTNDKGSSVIDNNIGANLGDVRYNGNAAKASGLAAQRAVDMKEGIKRNRSRGTNKTTATTVASAKGKSQEFGITARSGVSNLERQAGAARGAVASAGNLLRTGQGLADTANKKRNADFQASNQRKQGLLDIASVGITEGLGQKWDSDEAAEKKSAEDKARTARVAAMPVTEHPFQAQGLTDPYKRNYLGDI